MVTSIFKHLLSDQISLKSYTEGMNVTFDSVKRRMFALERAENKRIPDHYIELLKEQSFDGIGSMKDLMTKGIGVIAEELLEFRGKKLYIKQGKQHQWQETITRIPPLVLCAYFIEQHHPLTATDLDGIREYYHKYIEPNLRYTALQNSYIPQMELFVADNNGFHDLHMHLNGSVETDIAWQDFLSNPAAIRNELSKNFNSIGLVKEQFEEENGLSSPANYYNLLQSATIMRKYFHYILIDNSIDKFKGCDDIQLFGLINHNIHQHIMRNKHPFACLFENAENFQLEDKMKVEGLMYILLIGKIRSYTKNSLLANIFHYYLLILGLSNRLLVQQLHQYGFTQFQKITVNQLREYSEQTYRSRFLQLHGNEMRNIHFLEGRFSPKLEENRNLGLLSEIEKGWQNLLDALPPLQHTPELKVIAHFIKQKDKKPNEFINYFSLRKDLWDKARALALFKQNYPDRAKRIVGIDAASSEFDTPPEVFAPIYRYLRQQGFNHFTYHAGEDFFHIVTGLRAIYEAVYFTELKAGDRIGHATATGLSPKLWRETIGEKFLMRKGLYLDDIIFLYYIIVSQKITQLTGKLPFLSNKIQDTAQSIYIAPCSVSSLISAWKLRKYCPLDIIGTRKHEYKSDLDSYNSHTDESAKQIFQAYHLKGYRDRMDEIIEIDACEFFDVEELEILQQAILKYLHEKEIVIETLPTSNVRISYHRDFSTYHLGTWLRWENEGLPIPPIVVGSDDTGIFATNIYNEYGNIYYYLVNYLKYSHSKAMITLKTFEDNARVYRFE